MQMLSVAGERIEAHRVRLLLWIGYFRTESDSEDITRNQVRVVSENIRTDLAELAKTVNIVQSPQGYE